MADLVLQHVEGVGHLVAVEQREHRAAEAERRVVAMATRLRWRKQGGGARVVQQDAAVGIAHQHALRKLRHQGGEAVALFLDAGARFGAADLQVVLDPVVGIGKLVDRCGQFDQRRSARGGDAKAPFRGEQAARLLGKLTGGMGVTAEQPACGHAGEDHQQGGAEKHDGQALADNLDEMRPMLRRGGPVLQRGADAQHGEHGAARRGDPERNPLRDSHCFGAPPCPNRRSMAATSSCVENGLVM